jgi:hypothetical protein
MCADNALGLIMVKNWRKRFATHAVGTAHTVVLSLVRLGLVNLDPV